MTPDRFPRLFELAPGVVSMIGYSGRGIAISSIMGAELARWAAGGDAVQDLILPVSNFQTLPYYPLKDFIVDGAIQFYRAQDAIGHAAS